MALPILGWAPSRRDAAGADPRPDLLLGRQLDEGFLLV
jgi:hypothetical protein